ncbi:MAG: type II toxin-antitoxin system HicA family toxin [Phycisphaerales bacterium]|nr:type II toxin-antitoxin system HicA family toxin [Phycisphaerales bacterium]
MKTREIIRMLENDGWVAVRQTGSHRHFKHPIKPGIVTVAIHGMNEDLRPGTLNSILKQAGLK